ncbi:DUF3025 domain-containing protein [Psychrobacter urativorans]|uniref:DUF3025 domain-containing protein n=1 Tax=Psychrobacter urativorans TaxID=45610 RepID=A0A0M4T295_9GAMM|nr:DUF3025 domain-containing protein [Psychrobacter urativorans]ALF59640.1 hypothetical protein AOC03_05900 [Psychrobacter urativorans]
MSHHAKCIEIDIIETTRPVEIVIMNDTVPPTPSFTTPKASLDLSFAAIDWQAPWMAHISHLRFLSERVQNLSNRTECSAKNVEAQKIDKAESDKNSGKSSTVIADLLNTGMCQQAERTQHQPQTKLLLAKSILNNQAHTLKFVAQDDLPEGIGYEHFIGTTGNIPTRENLHDLFNGSIWLTFPKTKALLNYHHMLEMAAQSTNAIDSPKNPRGRVRDTITVFDENGAILVTCEPDIGTALIDFNWQNSLVAPRAEWDNPLAPRNDAKAAVYIFGHALLEQLIEPRKTLCAHSVVLNVSPDFFTQALPERIAQIDTLLAEHMHHLLSQEAVTPRQLAPLPILGVPHFWADNVNPEFYSDSRVFRSGRRTSL